MTNPVTTMDRATFLRRAGGVLSIAFFGRGRISGLPWTNGALDHPEPRAGITSEHVLSAEALGKFNTGKVGEAYDAARAHPEIFDGIACACSCGGKKGEHRSLLVCFETMQPTGCGSCQLEAGVVAKGIGEGKTLAEIRAAVDTWNS